MQPPYSYSWDTNNNSDGEYTLLAKALDASDNEGISTPIKVTVENQNKPKEKLFNQNHPDEGLFRYLILQVSEDIYYLGGNDRNNNNAPSKSLYKYNIDSKTWTQLADAPFPYPAIDGYFSETSNIIHHAGKLYASSTTGTFGDYNGEPFFDNTYAEYDIASNSWKKFTLFTDWFFGSGQDVRRADILTIGDTPYIFHYSNNQLNGATITSLIDASLYKKVQNVGLLSSNGFRLFQYEYGSIQKHFFDTGVGFFELNVSQFTDDSLIEHTTPPKEMKGHTFVSWKNFLLVCYDNSILVYNIDTQEWNTFDPPSENYDFGSGYLVNTDEEQGLFAIINSSELTSTSFVYFNLTYETFFKEP